MKTKTRTYMLTTAYVLAIIGFVLTTYLLSVSLENAFNKQDNINYVSEIILDNEYPVVKEEIFIKRPYMGSDITIGKSYYDYKQDETKQQNAIIYYGKTYMQNSGVDYVCQNSFDVLSVLPGVVTEITDDELLGKTIKVKHDNDLVSIYQSLSEINVTKNEQISSGYKLGTSGENVLGKDLKLHLHFELVHSGQNVNPEEYYDKNIKEL